jgi:hypothetical protein
MCHWKHRHLRGLAASVIVPASLFFQIGLAQAQPASTEGAQSQGMLDDVAPGQKGVVILPPAESKGGGLPKSSAPDPSKTLAAAPAQSPAAANPTVADPNVAAPAAAAANPAASNHFQLIEQVVSYGFVWRPRDQTNLINLANLMASRTDEVGQCLARSGATQSEIALMLQKDVGYDQAALTRTKLEDGYFQVSADLADRSIQGSAAYCLDNVTRVLPFYYYVYPPQSEVSLGSALQAVKDAKREDAAWGAGVEWRLPTAIEAFAIATLVLRDRNPATMSFWTTHNGAMGLLTIKTGDAGPEVDHTMSYPTNTKATTMISVHY